MPSIAITGAIGSGKSVALEKLAVSLQAASFSADSEVRRLLDHDAGVREKVISLLGPSCYSPDGKADRGKISSIVLADPQTRKSLEEILHPRIKEAWKPLAEWHRHSYSTFFIAEIPLLYENELEQFFDKVIVVGSSDAVRYGRLARGRSLSEERSRQWTYLQQSLGQKAAKADLLIWNDGSFQQLDRQISHLTTQIVSDI